MSNTHKLIIISANGYGLNFDMYMTPAESVEMMKALADFHRNGAKTISLDVIEEKTLRIFEM